MYVGVPCYNLKQLHQEIAWDMPEPRTLVEAWREMRDIWQKQKHDPTYALDTPLPSTATPEFTGDDTKTTGVSDGEQVELAMSLRELAPAGLSE